MPQAFNEIDRTDFITQNCRGSISCYTSSGRCSLYHQKIHTVHYILKKNKNKSNNVYLLKIGQHVGCRLMQIRTSIVDDLIRVLNIIHSWVNRITTPYCKRTLENLTLRLTIHTLKAYKSQRKD